MADAINLPILIGAAVIDSINPCAFGVLIFLLAYLSKKSKHKHAVLLHGFTYLFAVFLTYLLAGLLLLPIIQVTLRTFSVYAYYVIAGLIGLAGLIEIKDGFWPNGSTLTIMPGAAKRIKMYVGMISDRLSTAFALGVFVALVELPCTGAVYLAVLALMSNAGVTTNNVILLVIYNLIFVAPLGVIIVMFHRGIESHRFEHWRKKHRYMMRFGAGVMLLGLAIWMVAYALGL